LRSGLGSLSHAPAAFTDALERARFALSDRRGLRALGGRQAAEALLAEQEPGLDVPGLVAALEQTVAALEQTGSAADDGA